MMKVLKIAAAAIVLTGAAAPAWADPAPMPAVTPGFGISDNVGDTHIGGQSAGTHTLSGTTGHVTTIVTTGNNPSVEIMGGVPVGVAAYFNGSATLDYGLDISALNSDAAAKLSQVAATGNGNEIVGHLSGYLRLNANYSSLAQVILGAINPSNGAYGASTGAGCGGYICANRDTLVPVTLDVPKYVFDFGCTRDDNGAITGGCGPGVTQVRLFALGYLRNDPGLGGGSLDAYLDPVFTFDPTFLSNHGFAANSLTFSQNLLGTVPEPATWAMMILGFGVIGGAMRRRRAANGVTMAFA